MIFAWMSAIFAALTSILAKIGVQNVNSNLGTAIRTAVVLVMAWIVVAAKGKKNVFRGLAVRHLCLSHSVPYLLRHRGYATITH